MFGIANYGGNTYGGSNITIIVVIAMAGIAIVVLTWLGIRALMRRSGSRGSGSSVTDYSPPASMVTAPPGSAVSASPTRTVRAEPVSTAPQFAGFVARPASAVDPADELTKLADLRDRGVLTEAEFEEQKAKTLARS
jgi:Short C-terminal domain